MTNEWPDLVLGGRTLSFWITAARMIKLQIHQQGARSEFLLDSEDVDSFIRQLLAAKAVVQNGRMCFSREVTPTEAVQSFNSGKTS